MIRKSLPLTVDLPGVDRVRRLRLWLHGQGMTLKDLAARLGVHKTAPGKWLVSCRERLPERRRRELLGMGMPEGVLPEDKKADI